MTVDLVPVLHKHMM